MSTEFKVFLLTALAVVLLKVTFRWLTRRRALAQNASKKAVIPESRSVYLGLRDQALNLNREKIGIPPPIRATQPWAVLMDWGFEGGTATVVATANGAASVYLSSGGGSIRGGQSHESIRNAAKKMVSAAAESQTQMRVADSFQLPKSGEITFYALTDAVVYTATAPAEELISHRHPLAKLGDAAQEIMTQYRLVQKSN